MIDYEYHMQESSIASVQWGTQRCKWFCVFIINTVILKLPYYPSCHQRMCVILIQWIRHNDGSLNELLLLEFLNHSTLNSSWLNISPFCFRYDGKTQHELFMNTPMRSNRVLIGVVADSKLLSCLDIRHSEDDSTATNPTIKTFWAFRMIEESQSYSRPLLHQPGLQTIPTLFLPSLNHNE